MLPCSYCYLTKHRQDRHSPIKRHCGAGFSCLCEKHLTSQFFVITSFLKWPALIWGLSVQLQSWKVSGEHCDVSTMCSEQDQSLISWSIDWSRLLQAAVFLTWQDGTITQIHFKHHLVFWCIIWSSVWRNTILLVRRERQKPFLSSTDGNK